MPATVTQLDSLRYPGDPDRIVRIRVEGPEPATAAPGPAVIVLHGFKGFMNWGFFPTLSTRLAEAGFTVVSMNASGCGIGEDLESFTDNDGFARNGYTRELEDLDLVRDHLATLHVDPKRLAVFGHSRGGGMALLHAAERGDYRAVVTWAAISHIHRFDVATKAAWREAGELWIPNARTGQPHRLDLEILLDAERNKERLDILGACARLSAPTLLVHGTGDATVPFAESETLAAALPSAVHVRLDRASHTLDVVHPFAGTTAALEAALDATRAFLLQHV